MAKSTEIFTLAETAEFVKNLEPRNRIFYNQFIYDQPRGNIYVSIHSEIDEIEFKIRLQDEFRRNDWHFNFDRYRTKAYVKQKESEFVLIFWSSLTKDWIRNLKKLHQPREMLAVEILETRAKLSLNNVRKGPMT